LKLEKELVEVKRNAKEAEIKSSELVVGDIIRLKTGLNN